MVNKILVYIVSDVDKSLEFEWTASRFYQTYTLCFILIGKRDTVFAHYLKSIGVRTEFVTDEDYSSTLSKTWKIFWLLKKIRPDIVHCHLWRASLIGLTAAFLAGIKRRVVTRHHAMIHYHEFPGGRKWDRLCNMLATHIVAISENVKHILIEYDKASAGKVKVVHHGFDLDYFSNISAERVNDLHKKYKIYSKEPVIGVISRYLELKGFQYIVPAFKKLLQEYPNAHLVLANAKGNYQNQVSQLLETLPDNTYTEIVFETDLAPLYKLFTVFVHVPVDAECEAFGQTYVEALLCGIPSVFTLSGVAAEFIKHEQNALVVPFCNSEDIYNSIKRLLSDQALRDQLITNGKLSVNSFTIEKMISSLEALYAK